MSRADCAVTQTSSNRMSSLTTALSGLRHLLDMPTDYLDSFPESQFSVGCTPTPDLGHFHLSSARSVLVV